MSPVLLLTLYARAAEPSGVDAQRFHPAVGSAGLLTVTDTPVGRPWTLGGATTFSLARAPFVYRYDDPAREDLALLDHVGTLHLQMWGNVPRVRLAAELPLNVASSGLFEDARPVGDTRLDATVAILERTVRSPFGLDARLRATLPSGSRDAWLGEQNPTVGGDVLASASSGPALLALNLGARTDGGAILDGVAWGPELDFGLGLGLAVSDGFGVSAEVTGAHALAANVANPTPIEALGGLWLHPAADLVIRAGGGAGLTSGVGAPAWRAVLGVAWSPELPATPARSDTDGDGLVDAIDRCISEAEDANGRMDGDGCPDDDGRIPVVLEVVDPGGARIAGARLSLTAGPETGAWRLTDARLGRSLPPGTYQVAVEADGYAPLATSVTISAESSTHSLTMEPFVDRGRLTVTVRAPDGTLVPAMLRLMGGSVESRVGADDGVATAALPPGDYQMLVTASGYRSVEKAVALDAGGQASLDLTLQPGPVSVTEKELVVGERIYFETGSDIIRRRSFEVLDEVARMLIVHREITKLGIIGHTDDQGGEDANLDLSVRRAVAVKNYLVRSGVNADILLAGGVGEAQPLVLGTTEEARSSNRRVEFRILERKESP